MKIVIHLNVLVGCFLHSILFWTYLSNINIQYIEHNQIQDNSDICTGMYMDHQASWKCDALVVAILCMVIINFSWLLMAHWISTFKKGSTVICQIKYTFFSRKILREKGVHNVHYNGILTLFLRDKTHWL